MNRNLARKFITSLREGGWRDRAYCNGEDPALWDIPDGDPRHAPSEVREEVAAKHRLGRAICATCPVYAECLNAELDMPGPYGAIRAGLDPDELAREKRRRARARAAGRPYTPPDIDSILAGDYVPDDDYAIAI